MQCSDRKEFFVRQSFFFEVSFEGIQYVALCDSVMILLFFKQTVHKDYSLTILNTVTLIGLVEGTYCACGLVYTYLYSLGKYTVLSSS